jgi:hypothetical protein
MSYRWLPRTDGSGRCTCYRAARSRCGLRRSTSRAYPRRRGSPRGRRSWLPRATQGSARLELGLRLRYARAESMIQTIDRLVDAGKFNESEFLHTLWEPRWAGPAQKVPGRRDAVAHGRAGAPRRDAERYARGLVAHPDSSATVTFAFTLTTARLRPSCRPPGVRERSGGARPPGVARNAARSLKSRAKLELASLRRLVIGSPRRCSGGTARNPPCKAAKIFVTSETTFRP